MIGVCFTNKCKNGLVKKGGTVAHDPDPKFNEEPNRWYDHISNGRYIVTPKLPTPRGHVKHYMIIYYIRETELMYTWS